jgi:hypothetical protein
MQRLRGYFWRVRATLSARWWMLRFDLRAAWRLLRFAILAARGRVVILDEQGVESRGGYRYVQLAISQLPTTDEPENRRLT